MAEKTELETETEQSPEEAAQTLHSIAEEISSGEEITVQGNNASITVPGAVEKIGTEVEAEHEIKGKYDQVSVEVDLEWTVIPEESGDGHAESNEE